MAVGAVIAGRGVSHNCWAIRATELHESGLNVPDARASCLPSEAMWSQRPEGLL